jgi:hypothetical protein
LLNPYNRRMTEIQKSVTLTGFTIPITLLFMMTVENTAFPLEYKNYTSEKYGIQFEYPSNWTITEETSRFETCNITIQSGTNHFYICQFNDPATVSGWADVERTTPMWLRSEQNSREDIKRTIETPSYLTIDGKKAGTFLLSLILDKSGEEAAQQFWLVSLGDRIFQIINLGLTSNFDNPENKEIRNHFINSINFLGDNKSQSQQQFSKLTAYNDPIGKFTLEYDSSFWSAIQDNNRFNEIDVSFIDKATGGDETALSIGFVEDSMPNLAIKEFTEQLVPNFLGENIYLDRQLEEGIECGRMNIQGNIVCSFVYSEPQYPFDSYPRNYIMMFNAKIGNELLMGSFTSLGNQFDNLEQNVIQMINSMKIMTKDPYTKGLSQEVLTYEKERIEAQKGNNQKVLTVEEEPWEIEFCAKRIYYSNYAPPFCEDQPQEKIEVEVKKLEQQFGVIEHSEAPKTIKNNEDEDEKNDENEDDDKDDDSDEDEDKEDKDDEN